MTFGLIVGILYFIFGALQIIVGLGFDSQLSDALFIPKDIIGGFILVLIGVIFFFGFKELRAGISEGAAYIYIAIFLALIFVVIYLLIIAANAIEAYVLINEDFTDWSPTDDLKPGIYLGLLPFIGFIIWRSKFSLASRSKSKIKNNEDIR